MSTQRNQGEAGGADDYPYDPSLRTQRLRGLDRLRGIPDRKLARRLFGLHLKLEEDAFASTQPPMHESKLDALRRVAIRALDGEFGPEACEIAAFLLFDAYGQPRDDQRTLQAFANAFSELRPKAP